MNVKNELALMEFHRILHRETGLIGGNRYSIFKNRELKKNTRDHN